uniref:Uncharacterized protein n=1 Tax=Arundo donax TaxID=35708 RepID=A0A0A9EFT9_ARUDO
MLAKRPGDDRAEDLFRTAAGVRVRVCVRRR